MEVPPKHTDYDYLRQLLDSEADDAALCESYDRLLVSMNCESAAINYLAAVGFICARRPHLADRLLHRPIDVLLQIGAEDAGAVVWFVDNLVREPTEIFARWTGEEGLSWLRNEFPRLAESMGPLFDECCREMEARHRAIAARRSSEAEPAL